MCTAVGFKSENFYFGRTLDYEVSFGQEVVITPREFPFRFYKEGISNKHSAIVGTAAVKEGYPLYFDAVNEYGLCIAALNFVGNAVYFNEKNDFHNVAQYEFIPYVLVNCKSCDDAEKLLKKINITNKSFSSSLPAAELHWIIADRNKSITVESLKEGLKVYENPLCVLSNNPPFDYQMFALNNYMHLSAEPPLDTFSPEFKLERYTRGMGGLGLPGDNTSQSRFIRAAFIKSNIKKGETEQQRVSAAFHIFSSVECQLGCTALPDGSLNKTIYTSCMNADKGIYYYTTYENQTISAVTLQGDALFGKKLTRFSMLGKQYINHQN